MTVREGRRKGIVERERNGINVATPTFCMSNAPTNDILRTIIPGHLIAIRLCFLAKICNTVVI